MALKQMKNILLSILACEEYPLSEDMFDVLDMIEVPYHEVDIVEEILNLLLKKMTNEENKEENCAGEITQMFERGKMKMILLAQGISKDEELRAKAFKLLLKILPRYVCLYNKPKFPTQEYSELLEVIVTCEVDISCLLTVLQEYLMYEDMGFNLWKALNLAVRQPVLEEFHVQNILHIISTLAPKCEKSKLQEIGPIQYYCGVKIGVDKGKKIGKHVQSIWERLMACNVSLNTRQFLLHMLLEKMIFRMDKPIFLTDYFTSSLQYGGSISILALQGISILIQKYNINYPNIYEKLYDMFSPSMFGMHFKTRLFFLTDVFLSSLHLPETLVAGFAKRFANLSLLAPPADIIILMALINNLIIRHSGLKKLITNLGKHHYKRDPYVISESDPSTSNALESSLWELKLLQNHILPRVAAAATFIENPINSVECNLTGLLECENSEIFSSEIRGKVKEPSVSFENPSLRTTDKGFCCWKLKE